MLVLDVLKNHLWLIIGVTLLVFELYYRQYTKLIILSSSCILEQILIELGYYGRESFLLQIATVSVISILGFWLLDPILKKILNRDLSLREDPVGETATVASDIISKEVFGEILWRGKLKKSLLDSNSTSTNLSKNQKVAITAIQGSFFIVEPYQEAITENLQKTNA